MTTSNIDLTQIKIRTRVGDGTSDNLALTALGNGVGQLIQPSRTPPEAACVSAWSLDAMPPREE